MGHLAALKTTIAKQLSEDFHISLFYKDHIKELLTDAIGYQNREENINLSHATFLIIKDLIETMAQSNQSLMVESNFKYGELNLIKPIIDRYHVDVLTIFLTAEAEILYQRYKDRQAYRHKAHQSVQILDEANFRSSMFAYDESQLLGQSIKIDTSHYDVQTYHMIQSQLRDFLNE